MSRFEKTMQVIPSAAKVVAAIVYALLVTFLMIVIAHEFHGDKALVAGIAFTIAPMILVVYILLVGYVYGDARRRGMRYVLWTLLAIFIPNAIGILLYFVLRDPLPGHCTKCGEVLRPNFAYCPRCAAPVQAACRQCGRPVDPQWMVCAFCATPLRERTV